MSIAVNRPVSLLVCGLASIAIFSVLFSWAREEGQKNRGVKDQSKWKAGRGVGKNINEPHFSFSVLSCTPYLFALLHPMLSGISYMYTYPAWLKWYGNDCFPGYSWADGDFCLFLLSIRSSRYSTLRNGWPSWFQMFRF